MVQCFVGQQVWFVCDEFGDELIQVGGIVFGGEFVVCLFVGMCVYLLIFGVMVVDVLELCKQFVFVIVLWNFEYVFIGQIGIEVCVGDNYWDVGLYVFYC